ncbi:MAG: hypothetical protein U0457_09725 [Candidatus Sericytochromatia bacterium]
MFYNAELPYPYTKESLQKQLNLEGIKKTVKEILGYVVLAMNKYNTDWTIYVIKTEEDGDTIVYVEDEDELLVSTDYNDLFDHYYHQEGADVYRERFKDFMVYYGIINEE